MRISHVTIKNFRNFALLDVDLAANAVIVGENKIGKTNFLYALRLVLDPSLPDSARQLNLEDFWDGLPRPLTRKDEITVALDVTDFENDDNLAALLVEHLVEPESMTSRLTYVFRPLETLDDEPSKESDYEFYVYGGRRSENRIGHELRRRLPVDLLPALRDAEGDIGSWRRSPLRPLLDNVAARIEADQLEAFATAITEATRAVTKGKEVKQLVERINGRVRKMVGAGHAIETTLGFSPTDPDRILRALRMFIDEGKREIAAASLGSANVLYLTLKALELEQAVEEGQRHHTFLAIEEPEAHLHPHLQRLVYRDFLRGAGGEDREWPVTILLTTHSPHIVSVAPLHSVILLRKSKDGESTEAVSTANLALDSATVADLERYIDVTRGEMLFAKGVILVEGEAERFLVPALAKTNDVDFDELGISVCSVAGTNFVPYLALLGDQGLRLPVAVITDGDPANGRKRGETRAVDMLRALVSSAVLAKKTADEQIALARKYGVFVGDHTCEVDLFAAGAHREIARTLTELASSQAAKERAKEWRADPAALDRERLLRDIEAISKGRFAQRLSTYIKPGHCPAYIWDAIEYVRTRCR
jgi:putative ATP-dependent endonuclease of OLD family